MLYYDVIPSIRECDKGRMNAMKKKTPVILCLAGLFTLALILAGCGPVASTDFTSGEPLDPEESQLVEIDYGKSELYTEEEMDAAIDVIHEEFDTWEGCTLKNIRFVGDEANTKENVRWLNEVAKEKPDGDYTQCIEFVTDFHSPEKSEQASAWEPDTDYTDYQWWLGRADGSDWTLVTWGY